MTALINAKSFRFKEVQSNSGEGMGIGVVSVGEFVAPDKYRTSSDMNVFGKTGSTELLVVGNLVYIKVGAGQWEQKPTAAERVEREFLKIRKVGLLENLTNAKERDVKWLGQVQIEGAAHDLYQFSFVGPPETPIRTQNKIWVRLSDGLPTKIEMNSHVNQSGLKFNITNTTTYSDYNTTIEIKPPM